MPDLPASFDTRRFRTAARYYAGVAARYAQAPIGKVLELTGTRAAIRDWTLAALLEHWPLF